MDLQALTITATLLLSFFNHRCGLFRGLFHPAKTFHFIVVMSCTFFYLATCEPCTVNGMQKSAECKGCGSYGDNQRVGFEDVIGDDTGSGYIAGSSKTHPNSESVCTDLKLLCFPSTLPGLLSKEHKLKSDALEISNIQFESPLSIGTNQANSGASNRTWFSQSSMFKLLNDRTISCYLSSEESTGELSSTGSDNGNQNGFSSCRQTLLNQKSKNVSLKKNSELSKPGSFDVSSSPKVEINPPVLDWGQKYLFFPSVAFLTVANSFSDSILHIYELFSTSSQFYPCNSSEILLGPGEVVSICFVFLPRWLGLSTGRLILQTSSGGFLVPTRGFGVESPYRIQPLVGLDVLSSGRLSKNLSLFNPYDETLHVAEVTSWISVSVGNTTHHTEASCSIENFQNSDEFSLTSVDDWLVVRNGQVGFPLMAMRPLRNWEIGPRNSENIMEMDFPFGLEGKFFGAFCVKLLRSPHNVSDTVMIPLEVDLDGKVAYDDLPGPVSVSLEPLVSFDARGNVVAVSLRNGASYMLNVVRISEVAETKIFQIKYMEGLLLFPGTVTQVSVITCKLPVQLHDSLPEAFNINGNCKLLIMTNDSSSPQVEIPCQDIVHVCSRRQMDSSKSGPGNAKAGNTRTGSGGGGVKVPSEVKTLETAEADELVLGNWKSQGITSGMSVLDDHEVLFPIVQIGSYTSKWITVKNPSDQPVVMQLILNSGEIIDECRDADGFVDPPSSGSLVQGKSTRPTRYGFSIAESAVTEAYVHPHERAYFGPIFFHPSNRCAWRSSALIRNNLSGVEWLSLRGFGGSLSLVLFEGSELIESVEFNLSLPVPLNITPPDIFFHMEEATSACSQTLSKELYAKNTGDLPLEVRSIEVSGAGCRLDGFMVRTCKGFSLEPGESTKLLISYQSDFSAAMVHRDLELALAAGIFVIPMKASLPVLMLNICKKSVFWMRLKKLSIAVLAVSLLFLVFCCLYLQMIAFGTQDYFYKSEKSTITAIKTAGKSSRVDRNQKNSRISVPGEMDCLLRSVDEDTISREASSGKYPESKIGTSMKETSAQQAKLTLESHGHSNSSFDTQKEKALSFLPSKSVVVETTNTIEASHSENLTIRIGKEKGRKRRKRKVAGAVLSGLLEVSSSQSGNSTPSSPSSPLTTSIPNRSCSLSPDVDPPNGSSYLFTQMAERHCEKGPVPEPAAETKLLGPQPLSYHCNNQYSTPLQPSAPRKTASKPVLLPSATFPSTGKAAPSLLCSSPLASASTIAPHARAPGSKLYQETPKREQAGFTYDIWGDHFSGLSSIGRSKAVSSLNYSATKSDSVSFFVSGPQTLIRNSQSRSVSSFNQGG